MSALGIVGLCLLTFVSIASLMGGGAYVAAGAMADAGDVRVAPGCAFVVFGCIGLLAVIGLCLRFG